MFFDLIDLIDYTFQCSKCGATHSECCRCGEDAQYDIYDNDEDEL